MRKLAPLLGLLLIAACFPSTEKDNTGEVLMQGDTVLGHDQHATDAPISGTNLPAAQQQGPQSSVIVRDTAMVAPDTNRAAVRP